MAVKIVQVVNLIDTPLVGGGWIHPNAVIYIDKSHYSGTVTAYLEVVIFVNDSASSWTCELTTSPGDVSVLSTRFTGTNTTPLRARSTSNCWGDLAATGNYSYHQSGSALKYDCTTNAVRLIIIQSDSTSITATETQIEIGAATSTGAVWPASQGYIYNYWKYDASKWSGSISWYVDVSFYCTNTKGSCTVILQQSSGDNFTFSDLTTIVNADTSTASGVSTKLTRTAFTPTDGRNYRLTLYTSNSKYPVCMGNAKIVAVQTGSPITKLETLQIIQAQIDNVAGLRNRDIAYYSDTTEWDGVTKAIYSEMSVYGSGSIKFQSDPNGTPTDVPNSEVSGSDRIRSSSALTMPTGTPAIIDSNLLSGIVCITSLIFQVTIGPATSIKTLQGLDKANVKLLQGTAIASVKTLQGLA